MLKRKTDPADERAKIYGISRAEAQAEEDAIGAVDTERRAEVAPESSEDISEAVAVADAASERLENLRAEFEARRASIVAGVFAVGKTRKQINLAKLLKLSDTDEAQLAQRAITYFVAKNVQGNTMENVSGFRQMTEDLCFRKALNDHVQTYVKPLEFQVSELIESVRAEAKAAKIDLKKLISQLEKDRGVRGGEGLDHDSSLYAGLT